LSAFGCIRDVKFGYVNAFLNGGNRPEADANSRPITLQPAQSRQSLPSTTLRPDRLG